MLIEIHMLKNFAPTNLNRDDTGSPKTCMFGGVERGRISSQCLKRSWRVSKLFESEIGEENLGIRTRKLPVLVADELKSRGVSDEYIEIMKKKLAGLGNKAGVSNKKDSESTAQIIFYSKNDITDIADVVVERLNDCKNAKDVDKISIKNIEEIMKKNNRRSVSLDMALFGRMVTSDAFKNVEASIQVAHAISTNRVFMESDYFVAIDDLIAGHNEETGAAMINDTDYNSSCYYIYASIDTDKLKENLSECEEADRLVKKALPALIRTMIYCNPSGKQNSFAGNSLPSAVLVECKKVHIPVSYANAFEKPVRPTQEGSLVHNSIRQLVEEVNKVQYKFEIPIEQRFWFCVEDGFELESENTVNCIKLSELINGIVQ